jgi:hypothetical protein
MAANNIVPVMFRAPPTRPESMIMDFSVAVVSVGEPENVELSSVAFPSAERAANAKGHPRVAFFCAVVRLSR